ncbi:MAG: protein kinase [Planctomycetes bacterium]|nr:protein kinase [Planctomycetota bacterium]
MAPADPPADGLDPGEGTTPIESIGARALTRGFVTQVQFQEALREQARRHQSGREVSILRILVDLGFLTESQRREIETAPDAPPPPATARRLGRYALKREIARGGMGVVYEALDPELRRVVALKVVREGEADDEYIARLRREATIAAQLHHPNIVPIHEIGSAPGENGRKIHFIAMDFIEGRTFEAILRDAKRDRATLLRILEDVACAVAYAHGRGVIHRDLKPANVLVDGEGRVFLTDFGLARAAGDRTKLTQSNTALGTPAYMSPEQVTGDTAGLDARTDVYALGVMLYEILSGRPPFRGDSIAVLFHQILYDEPARPRRIDATIEPELEAICLTAMDRERDRRYPSAEEFARDLSRFRQGEPVAARPPGILRSMRLRARRHRTALVAAVALVVLATTSAAFLLRVRSERRKALEQLRKRTEKMLEAALAIRRTGKSEAMEPFVRETEEACRETMASYPQLAEPHYRLGRMYRALVRDEAALAQQDEALRKDPEYGPALYERIVLVARLYRRRMDLLVEDGWGDEGQVWIRAQSGVPSSVRPPRELAGKDAESRRLRARMEEDVRTLASAEAAGLRPGETACARGLTAWVQGDVARARNLLAEALRLEPNIEEACETLAWIALDAAKYEDAVRWCTEGWERDRGYGPHIETRAMAHILWGLDRTSRKEEPGEQYESAIRDYDDALARGATPARTLVRRGAARLAWAAWKLGRWEDFVRLSEEAQADFAAAIAADPSSPGPWQWRGVVHAAQAWNELTQMKDPIPSSDRALEDLDKAIELRPDRASPWIYRGISRIVRIFFRITRILDARPDCIAAIEDLDRALKLDDTRYEAWMWRGVVRGVLSLLTVGDPKTQDAIYRTALEDLDKAVSCAPDRPDPWMWRGEARVLRANRHGPDARGDYRQAIEDLRQSVKVLPTDPQAWRFLGEAHESRANWLAGLHEDAVPDYRDALAAFEKTAKLHPKWEPQIRPRMARCRKALEGK